MSAPANSLPPNNVIYTNNDSGNFVGCDKKTQAHILDSYLNAKIANLFGITRGAVAPGTVVKFVSKYNNDEGVIKDMEMEKGLRIDLQKAQKITVNNKENTYACLQVQWGTGQKKTGGAYAGVLILTEQAFTVVTIRTALEKSFGWLKYCRIDPG
jgi:hypothetical protein